MRHRTVRRISLGSRTQTVLEDEPMARKTTVVLEDDLDGGPADEMITFTVDGVGYEIDLSSSNAQQFRNAVAPYVNAARRTGRQRRQQSSTGRGRSAWLTEVRNWAQANGYEVAARGRVAQTVIDAYTAAQR